MASNDPSTRGTALSPTSAKKEKKPHLSLTAAGASSSEMTQVDPAQVAKHLHKDDKLSGKLKVKKSVTKASKAKDAETSCKNAHCPHFLC